MEHRTTPQVYLTCSFLRPLRPERGEQVDTSGWTPGPPPFLADSELVDRLDPDAPNPFFRDGPDDCRSERSLGRRERYFQNRMCSLLFPRPQARSGDDVVGRRLHSTDVFILDPLPSARDDLCRRQPPSAVTVIAREHLTLTIPMVMEQAQYVAVHLLVEVPPDGDLFAALSNALSLFTAKEGLPSMQSLGITLVDTPTETPAVRSSVHLCLPKGFDWREYLLRHAEADGSRHRAEAILQHWAPEDLAVHLLARRQTLGNKGPDPLDDRQGRGTVYLSYDWRAHVSRNGFTFLGLAGHDEPGNFHRQGRSLAQSMYFDALLLGQIQLDAANRIADTVVEIHLTDSSVTQTQEAERRLLNFRSKVWWSHVTEQAEIVNALLSRFQHQHQLPELVEQFNQDLTDLARFQSLRQESRTNRAIGLVSALFLAPTLVLSIASIYVTAYSWPAVAISTGAAAASGGVAFAAWWAYARKSRTKAHQAVID